MKTNLKIGITGGICSGKSQLIAYLKEKGYPVFSCDAINASLLENEEYIARVENLFPACIKEGKIDRSILASVIFSNESDRKALENIAHPLILERLFEDMSKESGIAFAEVPLLLEANLTQYFDKILVIMRKRDSRLRAITLRDGCEEEDALKKIQSQFPYEKAFEEGYFSNSKFVLIFNDSELENTYQQLEQFLSTL